MNATYTESIINLTETILLKNKSWNYVFQSELKITTREAFIITCYSVIILISIFGNLLVCNIVVRNISMRSSTYVFIANLALSDLMMTTLNIPFNVARLLLNNWPFGSFMCSFVPLMQVTTVYVSTFTMTCIAVDRYRIISKPLRPRLTHIQAIKAMICVWLLAILLSLPHAIFNKIEKVFTYRTLSRCRAVYSKNTSRWIELITVVTQYILPLSITGVLYCLIMARVWSRNALGVVTEAQLVRQERAKRKTIKMLMFVVMLFALCWLPLNAFHLLHEFNAIEFIYKSSTNSTHTTIYFICHWLAMSSVCYNPFIYCWLNEHFRSGSVHCFLCITNFGRKINSSLRSTAEFRRSIMQCETTVSSRFGSMVSSSNVECCSRTLQTMNRSKSIRNGSGNLRQEGIPMKSYCLPKVSSNGNQKCVKVQSDSDPNLHAHAQDLTEGVSAKDSDEEIIEKYSNGRILHGVKKSYSWNL